MMNKKTKTKEKGLRALQLTMMALGTVIGGSFFLGSSVAIKAAGPSVLISFIIGAVLVYFILFALSEMTVSNPTEGSFQTYAAEAYGPGTGFVVGWVYWSGMVLAMSSEATAVSILIRQWFPEISISILGSIIILIITLLNLIGANQLSKLESGLSIIKIFAIVAFIILGILLIAGKIPGSSGPRISDLSGESLFPGGIKGIAGSMLIVMFSFAGFEIIGLAASEAENPQETIPRAINYTVLSIASFYIISIGVLLFLIPTSNLNEDMSPLVAALYSHGMNWAGTTINLVLITAIISTMLAAMFGLGRMIRSLADVDQAPKWLNDKKEVPYHGILFSGFSMLLGLWFGLLLPEVYLFLVSAGGFSVLFTYIVIVASYIRFRKKHGCPEGKCRTRGYPYTSLMAFLSLIIILLSMPLIPGQVSGFIAGFVMVIFYILIYLAVKLRHTRRKVKGTNFHDESFLTGLTSEFSKELSILDEITDKEKKES